MAETSEEILGLPEETSEGSESTLADQDTDTLKTDLHIKCRGCFTQEDEMHYLFTSFDEELTLAHVVTQCTGYSCEKDDGFPLYLCLRCTTILIDFSNFKVQMQRTACCVETLLGKSRTQLVSNPYPKKHSHPKKNHHRDNSKKEDVFIPDLSEISGTTLECKYCPSTFPTKEACDTHMVKAHKQNTFSKYALFRQQVETHKKSASEPKERQQIGQVSIKEEEEEEECLSNIPGKVCRLCQKKIPDDEFKIHWEIHKVHVCEQCGHRFIKKTDLDLHKQSVHNDAKNYTCYICDKSFKVKPSLKRHINIHRNPRLFCCDICGERFNDSGTLKTHIRLKHIGTKDFVCPICGYAFNMKSTLDKHIIRHSENRIPLFSCEICKNPFQDKSSLKRHHLMKHTNDFIRPSCNVCGKTYSTGTKLRLHIEKHHGLNEVKRKKRGRKKLALSEKYHVSESIDESSRSFEDDCGSDSKFVAGTSQ